MAPGTSYGVRIGESIAIPPPSHGVPEYFRYRPPSSFEASGHIRLNKIVFLFPLRIIDYTIAG